METGIIQEMDALMVNLSMLETRLIESRSKLTMINHHLDYLCRLTDVIQVTLEEQNRNSNKN